MTEQIQVPKLYKGDKFFNSCCPFLC